MRSGAFDRIAAQIVVGTERVEHCTCVRQKMLPTVLSHSDSVRKHRKREALCKLNDRIELSNLDEFVSLSLSRSREAFSQRLHNGR